MRTYKAQPLDLMQYINTKYHEPFIHEKIVFKNSIDINHLKDAIDKLIDVFPILKCTYHFEDNTFLENEISADDLVVISKGRDDDIILLTESLDLKKQFIKFTICDKTLYITISHLVTDGSGFKTLLYALCDIYNGKEENYDFLMKRDIALLFKDVKKPSMIKMLASVLKSYKNRPVYEKKDIESLYIVERILDAKVMKEVHRLAKENKATLNDVFMTAYAIAIKRLCKEDKINIPCNVDLRKYTRELMGSANLTGTLNLNIKIKKDMDFMSCLKETSRLMNKQKKSLNDIAGPMLLVKKYKKTSLEKFLKTYGSLNTSPFVDYTNLGIIDEKRLHFNDLEIINAISYSSVQKAPYFQIAISSFKGATTFSSIFLCGKEEKKKIDLLLDCVVEEIIQFINE